MSFIVVCPYCGQKLCKAADGSKVVMQCPKCKEELDLTIKGDTVSVGKAQIQTKIVKGTI